MSSSTPSPATVLEVFDALASPGTPLTTPEVAEEFDCTNRTIYNKLEALVDDGSIETKKVGARGRVWWQPPHDRAGDGDDPSVTPDETIERPATDRVLAEQTRLVELIASGASLEECLSSLCTAVSTLDPTARASIVLTDDANQSFEQCIAPDLSPAWREELEGVPIDDRQIGTCGEAVFHGKPVTCEDIETDERWAEDWRELCLTNDIRAGHSVPIHDVDGDPLGSVMLCFDEPKAPTEWEQLADFGTHVASIAIERDQSHRALRENEERLRLATDAGETGTWEIDLQSDAPAVRSPRHDEIFGYEEPVKDWRFEEESLDHVHPADRERVEAGFEAALETGDWATECRIIRADGEQRWIAAHAEVYDDNGSPARVIGTVEDITERKEREQRLARQREQIEQLKDRLLDTSPTGILLMNEAGEITLANDRAQDILGLPSEDLIGRSHNAAAFDFVDLNGEPLPEAELPFEGARQADDSVFGIEVGVTRPDGQRVWLSINAASLYDEQTDEPTETVVALEEITERKQANDALKQLNTVTRELMDADPQTISERTAAITREVLDVPYTSLWNYDKDTGELQRHTTSTASEIDPDSLRSSEEFAERAWETFVSTELDVTNDISSMSESGGADDRLRSEMIVPLGRHGVIYAGSLSPGEFNETAVNLASTVGVTIETALDRAADEQQVARQNEELTRLNQINSIIRGIDQALVSADTREEINRVVCERLTQSDQYHCAWIGEYDLATEMITPHEWAGIDASYFETLTDTPDDAPLGKGPIGTAAQTHEVQVVEDIVTDARFASWREQTLAIGARACLAIPLIYNETLYGVLTVYASSPQTEADNHTVLGELGETIAHAINAVETKETLHTDSVVELELHFQDPDTPLCRLAQQTDCHIDIEGISPQANGQGHVFFTVQEVSPAAMQTGGESPIAIEELTCLDDQGETSQFKAAVADSTLPARLVEQDAVIRTLTIEDEAATAVVELPSTVAVRPFIESIQTHYPTADLRRRRTRDRSIDTAHTFPTTVDDRLTARQQDILQTAYRSGFFQSPREHTGKEIAAMLDISQPTFTQHLRAGQHNLCEGLFDET
jgi:PAS domain S-box-containing protein